MNHFTTPKNHSLFYSLLSVSLFFIFIFSSQNAKACVDPDTIATLTINHSADLSQVEIRIGNLKLETEAPNIFCSCGLASQTAVFTYVTYIAIVYEGTNDVYPNFVPFSQTSPADAAWDGSQPAIPNWNGYVAEVINNGLTADEAVEMIIRAEAPPGVLVELNDDPQQDSSLLYYQTYLGTDMWDPIAMDIVEDHQAVRQFGNLLNIKVNIFPLSYFDDLDQELTTSIHEVGQTSILTGKLYPNPVFQSFELSFNLKESADLDLVIYDIFGRLIHRFPTRNFIEGEHAIHISLEGIIRNPGNYLASLQSPTGQSNFKFVVQ